MINDLEMSCPSIKFVNDTTAYDLSTIAQQHCKTNYKKLQMKLFNGRKITAKTREMLICFRSGHEVFHQLVINECVIERVNSTKALGVMVNDTLK